MAEEHMADLTTGAQHIVKAAIAKRNLHDHNYLGVNHWLAAILERHGPMVSTMVSDLDVAELSKSLDKKLEQGDAGAALDAIVVTQMARRLAIARGKLQAVERDVVTAVLTTAGYKIVEAEVGSPTREASASSGPDSSSKTPLLDQFGRDLTRAAREGKLTRLIGREEEIELMMETLCRNTKRNPVLIGPAGVGKTAIVEGLANRMVAGAVPTPLKGARIVSLQPSVLVAGTETRGDLEKRMQGILKEAEQHSVILFIDEIHTIVGAGGTAGTNDIGALLKPALARGDVAVIAATTDDEYRRFIEEDTALERRFQPIRINELTPEQTYPVLASLREVLSKKYSVQIDDEVLNWLIQFAQVYMKNRHFPDKGVDLLEQSVAHAVAYGADTLSLQDAQDVAQRMVGMPLSLDTRLGELRSQLQAQGLMGPDEVQYFLSRLQVTLRGLDLRAGRPNAVLLLSGGAAEASETIAGVIAHALFGDAERVVSIDLSRMVHPEDVALLLGAPPGYVGYSDSLPLHKLAQIPWCVVRFEHADMCHPSVRAVVNSGLQEGRLTDGRGKPIYFSDTVVLLTAGITWESQRPIGFAVDQEENAGGPNLFKLIAESIGPELAGQIDLFLPGLRPVEVSKEWLKDTMLADLHERFLKQGVKLEWDSSLLDWMAQSRRQFQSGHDWERWVDYSLSPAIVEYLPKPGGPKVVSVMVKIDQNEIKVEALSGGA